MSAGGMDEAEIFGDAPMESNEETQLPEEFATMSAEDIERRTRLLDNENRLYFELMVSCGAKLGFYPDGTFFTIPRTYILFALRWRG